MTAILLAFLAALFTIAGGALPLSRRGMGERGLSLLVAFSAGVMLSTGINSMLPRSYQLAGGAAALGVSAGFVLLYLAERVTLVHACREHGRHIHTLSIFAIAGIGFHMTLDGFAIAVSGQAKASLGAVVALAVLAHRFPSGISFVGLMLSSGYERSRAWATLIVLALLAPMGATVGLLFADVSDMALGFAIGLSAGTFLYISTSDLLPVAHERGWRYYDVPLSFAAGFGVMLVAALALG
ncbi:zinc transporter ZupT [bacterium BMS3Abin01]|nr:zinc transporter ZupT [bacterium BMS3Abin01]HDZ59708.1 hypothetical protein [Actinomycetota bacterium]